MLHKYLEEYNLMLLKNYNFINNLENIGFIVLEKAQF